MKQQTKRIEEVARVVAQHPGSTAFSDTLRTLIEGRGAAVQKAGDRGTAPVAEVGM